MLSRLVCSPCFSRHPEFANNSADLTCIEYLSMILRLVEHFVLLIPEPVAHHAVRIGKADLLGIKSS